MVQIDKIRWNNFFFFFDKQTYTQGRGKMDGITNFFETDGITNLVID